MMAASSLPVITAVLLQLVASIQAVEITEPPQNTVVLAGSVVHLTCGTSETYRGYFEWRVFVAGQLGGHQIYSSPPFSASSPRFHKHGEFGLEIDPVEWRDAGKYRCTYLTGDVQATASVVVMDEPLVYSQPTVLMIGQSANLTCTVSFGGPAMDAESPPDTQGMFPQFSMSLGPDRPLDLSSALLQHDPGQPGTSKHRLTVLLSHEVSMDDLGRSVTCTVSTADPEFSTEVTTELKVYASAQDVTVEPSLHEYSVGDVINCSASGSPAPTLSWRYVSGPNWVAASEGRALNVVEEMRGGLNVWKCIATNSFGSDELEIRFNVTVAATNPEEPSGASEGGGHHQPCD